MQKRFPEYHDYRIDWTLLIILFLHGGGALVSTRQMNITKVHNCIKDDRLSLKKIHEYQKHCGLSSNFKFLESWNLKNLHDWYQFQSRFPAMYYFGIHDNFDGWMLQLRIIICNFVNWPNITSSNAAFLEIVAGHIWFH